MSAMPYSYVRAPGLVADAVDDEVVILDLRTGRVHQLNPTASRIWHECAHGTTAPDIAAHVAAAFDSAPSATTVEQDVRDALAQFERLGLLCRVEGGART